MAEREEIGTTILETPTSLINYPDFISRLSYVDIQQPSLGSPVGNRTVGVELSPGDHLQSGEGKIIIKIYFKRRNVSEFENY
jgi:hypothetical protein